jgi:hypothetical protein
MSPPDAHDAPMTNATTTPIRPWAGAIFAAALILATLAVSLLFILLMSSLHTDGGRVNTPLSTPTPVTPPTTHDTDRTDESRIYPGDHADYHDGAWWVDGVKVTGVDCPAEDSCYAMEHDGGIMIHEDTP